MRILTFDRVDDTFNWYDLEADSIAEAMVQIIEDSKQPIALGWEGLSVEEKGKELWERFFNTDEYSLIVQVCETGYSCRHAMLAALPDVVGMLEGYR